MMHKTEAAVLLIKNALKVGIKADYVLMDTWFTTEPMITEILETGIDAIGMVKQLKQRYTYNVKQYKLPELKKFVSFEGARNIFGSLVVTTQTGIPAKIVFVRNRNCYGISMGRFTMGLWWSRDWIRCFANLEIFLLE